jgi:hypothetical protein
MIDIGEPLARLAGAAELVAGLPLIIKNNGDGTYIENICDLIADAIVRELDEITKKTNPAA